VLDTGRLTVGEVVERILRALEKAGQHGT
jgi:hypothetical protein